MALLKLQFKPGLNRDITNYAGEGGWWDCDKIRFHSGQPEKLGGWERYSPNGYFGVCRQLNTWVTTYSELFLGVGTNNKLYVEQAGIFHDITPIRATFTSPATNNSLSTTAFDNLVTVNLTGHGAVTGDFVTISGVTGSVGGIPLDEINTNVQVTVTTPDQFTFITTTAASSTVAGVGGTAITMAFEANSGSRITFWGYGWGAGAWSRGTWGGPSVVPIKVFQQDWWLDNLDNDLFANIRNGAPYVWLRGSDPDPVTALGTRAITLQQYASDNGAEPDDVPSKVMQLLVSQQDRHLIAFGAVPFGETDPDTFDPMLIRWSDQDTPYDWTPTVTNSAGFLRVSRGSLIVSTLPSRQEILVWTDASLYTLQFLGTTDVFSLQEYAADVTIAGPRARTSASNVVYWMGKDKFYTYSGRVDTLFCPLVDYVFGDLNAEQRDQIVAGANEKWNEVWWFYPSATSETNDRYVVYNYTSQIWFFGTMERTAWLDSRFYPGPLGASEIIEFPLFPPSTPYTPPTKDGVLFAHEVGTDDDGEPMVSYIQSNDFDLGDGDKFMLSRRIIPDVSFRSSTALEPEVTLTVKSRNFPGSAYSYSAGVQDSKLVIETAVDVYTEQVFIRARARQMALRVTSDQLGVHWELGTPRLDVREDGSR
jgi:hypothetical protein